MPIIDVHAHHVPESVLGLVGYTSGAAGGASLIGEMTDLAQRVADMDRVGVEMQAISGVGGVFGRDLATASAYNDAVAISIARYPDRFVAMAVVPLGEPDKAPAELERAVKELGMVGVSIGSNVHGKNLDQPEFGAFFAKAQELNVPMFIHPVAPQVGLDRLGSYGLDNLIGNVTDTAVAAASLIFGHVLDEFPRLKPYLAHGGGSCPFIRGRWDRGWRARGAGDGLLSAPSEYLKRFYYDALTHSHEALEHLVRFVGAGHVMLGSDYPYDMGDPDPVRQIESAPGLTDVEKRQVLRETAVEVFGVGRA